MNSYDLEAAFFTHLRNFPYMNFVTLKPTEVKEPPDSPWRRGWVILAEPETIGFGNGVYSRTEGVYQIDLYVPLFQESALRVLRGATDAHVTRFWPENGRGLTIERNETCAHILRRPNQRHLSYGNEASAQPHAREGAFLRAIVEVDFFVEHYPNGG